MAWIAFHGSIVRRLKKFHDFRRMMNWEELFTLGILAAFWAEALELRESGDISDWSADYLCNDLLKMNIANPVTVLEAMINTGWIDRKVVKDTGEERLLIHDWIEYAGKFLQRKYKTNQRDRLLQIWMMHGLEYGAYDGTSHGSGKGIPKGFQMDAYVDDVDDVDNVDNTKGKKPDAADKTIKQIQKNSDILSVLDHFNAACKIHCPKGLKLTDIRKRIIDQRLFKDKISIEDLKKAITNFSKDEWEDRGKYCDIVYAIGIRNKVDNFAKWINYVPKGRKNGGQEIDSTDKFKRNGFAS
jgi:hypothetical protein